LKPKIKYRRLQADIPESLSIDLAQVCEELAVSKSQFIQKSLIQSLDRYCRENPERSSKSLDLLRESEDYLLD
jgi:hypothetical protein